jgi:hypothetical protein
MESIREKDFLIEAAPGLLNSDDYHHIVRLLVGA